MNKLIYFASPYSHDDYMIQDERFETMRAIVAEIFIQQSVIFPYSPIVYSHDLNTYIERVDNIGFDWVERDKIILAKCDGMVVVTMDGWKESVGVQEEIKFCEENDIPITYMHPIEVNDFIMQFVSMKNVKP